MSCFRNGRIKGHKRGWRIRCFAPSAVGIADTLSNRTIVTVRPSLSLRSYCGFSYRKSLPIPNAYSVLQGAPQSASLLALCILHFSEFFLRIFLSNCFTKSYKNISKIHPKWVNIYPLLWENMWEISLQNIIKILCEKFTKITYKKCERNLWESVRDFATKYSFTCVRLWETSTPISITSCARMWGNVREIFTKNIQIRIIKFHSNFMKMIDLSLWEIVRAFLQIFLTTCERMWENKLTIFFTTNCERVREYILQIFNTNLCENVRDFLKRKW